MTLNQVLSARDAWGDLLQKQLPTKLSYRLSKYMKKVIKEITDINEFREKLIKEKYGKVGEDGQSWSIPPENIKPFSIEFEGLLAEEADIPQLPVTMDELMEELGRYDNSMTPASLLVLEPFFKEAPEEVQEEAEVPEGE